MKNLLFAICIVVANIFSPSLSYCLDNPQITAAGPTTICEGENLTLTAQVAPNSTYQWMKDGAVIANENSMSLSVSVPGSYSISQTLDGVVSVSNTIDVLVKDRYNSTMSPTTLEICGGTERADWYSVEGVSTDGGVIRKTKVGNVWDSYGYTFQRIIDRGSISGIAVEANKERFFGLQTVDRQHYYGIHLFADGQFSINETNSFKTSRAAYQAGDLFKIVVDDKKISYFRNGVLVYSSSADLVGRFPLMGAVTFSTNGGSIKNPMVQRSNEGDLIQLSVESISGNNYQWHRNEKLVGSNSSVYSAQGLMANDVVKCTVTNADFCNSPVTVQTMVKAKTADIVNNPSFTPSSLELCGGAEAAIWLAQDGVEITGGIVKKTKLGNNWDGYAHTVQQVSTRGYIEGTALEANKEKFIGFITPDSKHYGILLLSNSQFRIHENGSKPNIFYYKAGDKLKVFIDNGQMNCYQNGKFVFSSDIPAIVGITMKGGVTFSHNGGSFQDVVIQRSNENQSVLLSINSLPNSNYQWYTNDVGVGTNSNTYTATSLFPEDNVKCYITNTDLCVTPNVVSLPISNKPKLNANVFSIDPTTIEMCEASTPIWGMLDGASVEGGTIRKSKLGDGWGSYGKTFNQIIDNGYIEGVAVANNKQLFVGLIPDNKIDYYGFSLNNGQFNINESNSNKIANMFYQAGDRFRVAIQNNEIRYYFNGLLIYSSKAVISDKFPLVGHIYFYSSEGSLTNLKFLSGSLAAQVSVNEIPGSDYRWFTNGAKEGTNTNIIYPATLFPDDRIRCYITNENFCIPPSMVETTVIGKPLTSNVYTITPPALAISAEAVIPDWALLDGVTFEDGVLQKTRQDNSHNGFANTSNEITKNGFIEGIVPDTDKQRFIGLANRKGVSGSYFYGFFFYANRQFTINEFNSNKIKNESYQPGDVFRVAVFNNEIRYYHNGLMIYLSKAVISDKLPFVGHASFAHTGGSFTNVKFYQSTKDHTADFSVNSIPGGKYNWYHNGELVETSSDRLTANGLFPDDKIQCFITNVNSCVAPATVGIVLGMGELEKESYQYSLLNKTASTFPILIKDKQLRFIYNEEYMAGKLVFNIYDMKRRAVFKSSSTGSSFVVPNKVYGMNEISLDLSSLITNDEPYLLEVINSKGEKEFIVFTSKTVN